LLYATLTPVGVTDLYVGDSIITGEYTLYDDMSWLPDSVISFVIMCEGNSYVNDPTIKEESRMGITNHAYKAYFGRIDSKSIVNLKKHEAVEIYKYMFWDRNNLDSLVTRGYNASASILMDSEVNIGPYRANKMFQRILGMPESKRTGRIDSLTLLYLDSSELTDEEIYNKMRYTRKTYYKNLVVYNDVYSKYEDGWLNRLDSMDVFISMI